MGQAAAEETIDDAVEAMRSPWRARIAVALLVLAIGAGVAAWFLIPRSYEGLSLLPSVSEHAYTEGGRPSPGTAAQQAFFEHALPTFFIALDNQGDPVQAARALETEAGAELPADVRSAVLAFVDACTRARASTDPESAILVQQAAAAVNRALAGAELGYYVDTQVVLPRTGALRVFAQTFVVEHVGRFTLGPHTERALSIRRLDHTNIALPTLGFTRPEANEGLVQVDRIEEHLVAHVLPTFAPDASFRYAEPHVQRSQVLTQLEALAGESVRRELMAGLVPEDGVALGTAMHARRALFERWQNVVSARDAVFLAPTTYEVDMAPLESYRWELPGFQELRDLHATLGEPAVVTAYLHTHHQLVRSVQRHELQHRYDYREAVFETAPAGLAEPLLHVPAGAPLGPDQRVVVAELSAYCAAMADGPATKTELLLLVQHLLGLGGGRRHEARAGGFLVAELYAELIPAEPILGDRPIHHATRTQRLLAEPTGRLRSALRTLWQRWFGRPLPTMQAR